MYVCEGVKNYDFDILFIITQKTNHCKYNEPAALQKLQYIHDHYM